MLGELAGQGKKALVLGHSAGGLIGNNATKGQDNVIGMIYMAAFVIPRGKALLDLLRGKPLPWMEYKVSRTAIMRYHWPPSRKWRRNLDQRPKPSRLNPATARF